MWLRLVCLCTLAIALGSCGGGDSGYRFTDVVSGLDHPLLAISAPDGSHRLFLVEQTGRIKVLAAGASVPTVFLDLSPSVLFDNVESGLLSLVFHPQFATNRRFFIFYQRPSDGSSVLSELHASAANANVADTAESVMLVIPQPAPHHRGGDMHFGTDGYLYLAVGDGSNVESPAASPQDPQSLLGKMLRIDIDNPAGGLAYSSPPDNPYVASGAGRSEIYALGFRNPWRFAFDSADGRLLAGDVGLHQREEIDVVIKAGNYGWTVWEGTLCTGFGPGPCDPAGYTMPILEYPHLQGRCSVIGGPVYRAAAGTFPQGSYVYGDFCTGEVFMLQNGAQRQILRAGSNITSFGLDDSGEVLVVTVDGRVRRISRVM